MGNLPPWNNLTAILEVVVYHNVQSDDGSTRGEAISNVFEQAVGLWVMERAGNGEYCHVLFGVILDKEVDDIPFPIDYVCVVDQFSEGRRMGGKEKHVRPKGLSEGKEPVTLISDSGSVTVSSATVCG
jgi:hypothetical protein